MPSASPIPDSPPFTPSSNEKLSDGVTPQRSSFTSFLLVLSCTGALVTHLLGATSMSIALPVLGQEMGIPIAQLQWLISSYALSSGCFLLLFGRIADLHGRKHVFSAGMLWTLAFSLGCAFANDFITLAILRAFQGVGLAAAMPSALGILAHAFKEGSRARSIAFASFAAGAPLGAACGAVLGGVLVQTTDQTWRSTFYLTAGLVFLFLVMGLIAFPKDVSPGHVVDRRVDWIGASLITSGLVLIVFVLGQGELAPQKWATPYIIALLIVGVILIVAFAFWQIRLEGIHDAQEKDFIDQALKPTISPPPILKFSLLKRANGRYGVMMLLAFLTYTCFNTWFYWDMIFYQENLKLTPIQAAIRFIPMPVTGLLCNVFIALVIGRLPLVVILVIGTGLASVAVLLFAVMDPSVTYWAYQFPAMVISVFGADFIYASGTLYVAQKSHQHEQSISGALFQTMTQLATAFGAAITTVVFDRVNGESNEGLGTLKAYRAAWWMCFAFGILAILLSVIFFWNAGILVRKEPKRPDSEEIAT